MNYELDLFHLLSVNGSVYNVFPKKLVNLLRLQRDIFDQEMAGSEVGRESGPLQTVAGARVTTPSCCRGSRKETMPSALQSSYKMAA